MKSNNYRILSTRELDTALIEKAAYQNITIDSLSFIEIKKFLSEENHKQIEILSKQQTAVVFTSQNAVEIVVDALPKDQEIPPWKIYCLGGASFTLVKKYWPYDNIRFTAKNAAELAEKIVADIITEIKFFCGNKRREELPQLLAKENVRVTELVVYETIETPITTNVVYDGILFFSPSAVTSFFSNNQISSDVVLFAIGNTTANTIKQFAANHIIISEFPAKDQLVDKAIEFFSKISAQEKSEN
jgi:uroporphyrinogen-III synthase